MPRTLKVAVAGLGPVGQAVVRLVLQTPGSEAGGRGRPGAAQRRPGPRTACSACRAAWASRSRAIPNAGCARRRADVAFVCTSSLLKDVKPLVQALVDSAHARADELRGAGLPGAGARGRLPRARPARAHEEGGAARHRRQPRLRHGRPRARPHGPLRAVRRVSVTRVVDAGGRCSVQRRVGAGLNLAAVPPRADGRYGPPRGAPAVGADDRGGARLEARAAGRDASSPRSRRATSTPSTCASPPAPWPASSSACAATAAPSWP